MYADRRARLWDAKAKELWRSMGVDKAEELIDQGGWTEMLVVTVAYSSACVDPLSAVLWKLEGVFRTSP